MKICGYCNKEYDEKETQCPFCGARMLKHTKGAESAAEEYRRIEEDIKKKREKTSRILGIGVGVVALIIFILIFRVVSFFNDPQRDIDKESKQLYEMSIQQIKDGEYDSAIETLDNINVLWSEYDKVSEKKAEAVKGQLSNTIAQYESIGDYESIIIFINENIEDIGADSELEEIYNRSKLHYKEDAIAAANQYVESGNYSSAISVLTTAINVIGTELELENKISEFWKREILATVLEYREKEELEEVIYYINKNIDRVGNDSEILIHLNECKEQYRELIIREAESSFNSDGYEAAIKEISKGLSVLIGDETLVNERKAYEKMTPVALRTMRAYVGELYPTEKYMKDIEDNMGNVYSESYSSYAAEHSAIYDIGARYDILKGIVAVGKPRSSRETFTGVIKVYGDGRLIWSDNGINSSMKPYEMNVNVSGITDLEIVIDSNGPGPVILADVVLQKTSK